VTNFAFLPLLDTDIKAPENPALGGWEDAHNRSPPSRT
jgi:hypothetical protein